MLLNSSTHSAPIFVSHLAAKSPTLAAYATQQLLLFEQITLLLSPPRFRCTVKGAVVVVVVLGLPLQNNLIRSGLKLFPPTSSTSSSPLTSLAVDLFMLTWISSSDHEPGGCSATLAAAAAVIVRSDFGFTGYFSHPGDYIQCGFYSRFSSSPKFNWTSPDIQCSGACSWATQSPLSVAAAGQGSGSWRSNIIIIIIANVINVIIGQLLVDPVSALKPLVIVARTKESSSVRIFSC